MRTLIAIVTISFVVAGCTAAGLAIPSLDACEKVSYVRDGDVAVIYAECKVR